jgi:uncharacterized protein (DUF2267 family)
MTATQSVNAAAHAAEDWIDDLVQHLGWRDRDHVYLALMAAMHALRDRLHKDEAIYLGAQLSTLVRGLYYEGHDLATRRPKVAARSLSVFMTVCTVSRASTPNRWLAQCLPCWRHAYQLRKLRMQKLPRPTSCTIFGRADA